MEDIVFQGYPAGMLAIFGIAFILFWVVYGAMADKGVVDGMLLSLLTVSAIIVVSTPLMYAVYGLLPNAMAMGGAGFLGLAISAVALHILNGSEEK